MACGVDAGPQPLGGGFLVARGAVDLAGQKKAPNPLGFKGRLELAGIHVIVFDGIGRTDDLRLFQPLHGMDELELDLQGKAVSQARGVSFVGIEALGFQDDLMFLPV